ncbi:MULTISPECIES: hypothetical protein [unclassified Pannonibacter]|uniref:hypothetical protein n=1 Tax=unclassified Pannonibacter TaxID=2627228 RepID=UPI001645B3F6|nr:MULTISPECIES: hypothetical protein [unclassified Pannonibacter]
MNAEVIKAKGLGFFGAGYDLIRRNRNYQMLAGAFAIFSVMHLLSTPSGPSGPAGGGPAQANVGGGQTPSMIPGGQQPSMIPGGPMPQTVMPGQQPFMPYQQQGVGTVTSGVGMAPGMAPGAPAIPSFTVHTGPVQSSSPTIDLKPSEEISLDDIEISEARDTGAERKPSERYRDYRTPTAPARNTIRN